MEEFLTYPTAFGDGIFIPTSNIIFNYLKPGEIITPYPVGIKPLISKILFVPPAPSPPSAEAIASKLSFFEQKQAEYDAQLTWCVTTVTDFEAKSTYSSSNGVLISVDEKLSIPVNQQFTWRELWQYCDALYEPCFEENGWEDLSIWRFEMKEGNLHAKIAAV